MVNVLEELKLVLQSALIQVVKGVFFLSVLRE